MSLYAQHGHAKSNKLEEALDSGSLDGVIFGARNEKAANITQCIENVKEKGAGVLFDPQFHVSAIIPANDRFLPEYPYYKAGRTAADFVGSKKIANYAKATLDYQMTLGVDRLISPTVIFESFESKWAQTALNMADASLEYCAGLKGAPDMLLSFVVGEQALSSTADLDAFLDQVTAFDDLAGIYLIIAREDSAYSQRFDPERLKNALYTNYVLGSINGFEVVNGFSDFCGVLLRAVGGDIFASGWSQGQRQFHRKNFTKQKPGGQLPLLRYSSQPLLNSIRLSELQQIYDAGYLQSALSGVPYDSVITSASSPEDSTWSARISELHHWQVLKSLDIELTQSVSSNLQQIESMIEEAQEIYVELIEEGVVFSVGSLPTHLGNWEEGIKLFREMSGV